MARLRYNGLSTTLGASLTSSATAVTFGAALTHSNGTAVPTITGSDYIPLAILDSNGHLLEIVWLTAYTAGATAGTIVRGKEGTSGVTHNSGDKVVCGVLVYDVRATVPDAYPDSPSAYDDEFDGTSSVVWADGPRGSGTGWTLNTDIPGAAKFLGDGTDGRSKIQNCPTTFPFTMTTKIAALRAPGTATTYFGGLLIGPASPTTASNTYRIILQGTSGTLQVIDTTHSNWGTTFVSGNHYADGELGIYLRMRVNSATSVDTFGSRDGEVWMPLGSGVNPGFTPGVMGLFTSASSGYGVAYKFFRVT